jgi:predicted O-methyltransferase YrrM
MNQENWTAVDRYLTDLLVQPDAALDAALEASAAAGLPAINVSPAQGKLLYMLARLVGARNILEIGTLGGYSTIWMARALPADGRLITLEIDEKNATIARANFERAGVDRLIELRLGTALDTLPALAAEKREPFDLIFIDADKQNNPDYFAWALRLARIGCLVIVDNVIRGGAVIDGASHDASVLGTRRCLELMAAEPRVISTALQTVGSKGYDGFAIAMVVK